MDDPSAAPSTVGFPQRRTVRVPDPQAKRYRDHGEWGYYDGALDGAGRRCGPGQMTYDSGNTYEGPFADDAYEGAGGVYRWADGDVQEGGWRGGERHGTGVFRGRDGRVAYATYEAGATTGEGVTWSADRTVAHRTTDGVEGDEMSRAAAERLARERFGLPVPEPATDVIAAAPAPASKGGRSVGLLGRLFATRRTAPDGTRHFKGELLRGAWWHWG